MPNSPEAELWALVVKVSVLGIMGVASLWLAYTGVMLPALALAVLALFWGVEGI